MANKPKFNLSSSTQLDSDDNEDELINGRNDC